MHYYVSMVEPEGQRRKWLLAGPYATEEEAVAAKPHAVRLAVAHDPWWDFNLFGLAKSELEHPTPLGALKA